MQMSKKVNNDVSMNPPIATVVVDCEGGKQIESWIESQQSNTFKGDQPINLVLRAFLSEIGSEHQTVSKRASV